MESWELSKENFVPVKNGRSKTVLQEGLDVTASTTKETLEAKRRYAKYEADDDS